jgi:predicted kinase
MRCHKYLNGEITKLSKRELFEIHPYAEALIKFSQADNRGRIENKKTQAFCIITVGIPGSGKSTWRKNFIEKHPEWSYINPDELRMEYTGSPTDQSKDAFVWVKSYSLLSNNMKQLKDTIFDSTAVNTKTQALIEKTAKMHGGIVLYKFFWISPEIAVARIEKDIAMNKERSNVPSHVVYSMYDRYVHAENRVKEARKNFDAFIVEYPRK